MFVELDRDHLDYLTCAVGVTTVGVNKKCALLIHFIEGCFDEHCWNLPKRRYLLNKARLKIIEQRVFDRLKKKSIDWQAILDQYIRYRKRANKKCKRPLINLLRDMINYKV